METEITKGGVTSINSAKMQESILVVNYFQWNYQFLSVRM
jgi:hypothetical protein